MCGIAGIATADGSAPDVSLLKAMTDTLVHRGPDGEGHLSLPGCGLGHRRLAIIDLEGGAQPMADEPRTCWVTFNGEIYNFLELRPQLEARGHRLRTRSDTEVLVHLIGERGPSAIRELRGMFALGAWDTKERRLILARDRMGKKPLYWFADLRGIYFASEIKALLALPHCPREVDPEAIDLYLAYQAVPGTRTIFKGIQRLAPASTLTWSARAGVHIEQYWTVDWARKTAMPYEDARRQLRLLIVEATRARLISDVPLGAFLSGGVDSSAVVSAMAECTNRVKTFSIGFAKEDYNETAYARLVAERFGTEHEEFVVEPNAVEVLPALAWHYDQPFGDSSALPTYYVSRMTRQRVTVALNGDGGDELFGGYERHRALLVQSIYRSWTTPSLRALLARVVGALPAPRGATLLHKLRLFTGLPRQTLDDFNLRLFHHRDFPAGERSLLYTPTFAARIGPANADRYFLQLMAESMAKTSGDPVDAALRTDTLMYLPDTLLVKVDIASMAVSLEARSPLLDASVVEFAASLPSSWKVTTRGNKKILKEAHDGILPREVLYRPKMGFSLPLAHWFRHELYGYLREQLLDDMCTARGYFRREAVESLIEEHRSGQRNHEVRLWSLLMLEHWHREILDAQLPQRALRTS
jgi:asparagine synthase (glutamine-hydrolysing)